jgi:hypothetical protein
VFSLIFTCAKNLHTSRHARHQPAINGIVQSAKQQLESSVAFVRGCVGWILSRDDCLFNVSLYSARFSGVAVAFAWKTVGGTSWNPYKLNNPPREPCNRGGSVNTSLKWRIRLYIKCSTSGRPLNLGIAVQHVLLSMCWSSNYSALADPKLSSKGQWLIAP